LLIFLGLNKSRNDFFNSTHSVWPDPTYHEAWCPATYDRLKGWLGLGLTAWWQGAAGELVRGIGRASDKAVGGGTHPSDDAAERWWRMLRAAAFTNGEGTPVMDGVDGVALQCWGRRENVRGESIWTERKSALVLTDKGGQPRCSGGNQRGGGISSGGNRARWTRRQWRRRGARARNGVE
jgi:hypothetical protein